MRWCVPWHARPNSTNAEIVRVTNVATDTLTITRGPQAGDPGGVNRAIVVGDQIFQAVTTKMFTDIEPPWTVAANSNPILTTAQISNNGVLTNKLLSADTYAAFSITGAGNIGWGVGGSTAQDTTLARTAAGGLDTDRPDGNDCHEWQRHRRAQLSAQTALAQYLLRADANPALLRSRALAT